MPVVTIRASKKGSLRAQAQAQATRLLEAANPQCADNRVLVVYGDEAASIYYEGQPDSAPASRPRAN